MVFSGIVIGLIACIAIGIFHPLVIYGEYHCGVRLWPCFLVAGIILCLLSLLVKQMILNATLGILAFCCFWSIHELFRQKKRVEKGWFPKKPHKASQDAGDEP
ncbi:MAG: DUF4491 family protein [Treponema sp.]|jgi:hypothetical protein|nr:DUF4491 family protein [Treponema sp.]